LFYIELKYNAKKLTLDLLNVGYIAMIRLMLKRIK
jgi:hypothetical protein